MTNNLRDEIARREKICEAATPLPDTGHSQACVCEACSACWKRGAEYQAAALGIVTIAYPETLAALADAVAALEKASRRLNVIAQLKGPPLIGAPDAARLGAEDVDAALAQIAGRLGHMDVGREGEG